MCRIGIINTREKMKEKGYCWGCGRRRDRVLMGKVLGLWKVEGEGGGDEGEGARDEAMARARRTNIN